MLCLFVLPRMNFETGTSLTSKKKKKNLFRIFPINILDLSELA